MRRVGDDSRMGLVETQRRFQRYVDGLSDADALVLHRIVCRRAAAIYGPMHRARQQANYKNAMAVYTGGYPAQGRMNA